MICNTEILLIADDVDKTVQVEITYDADTDYLDPENQRIDTISILSTNPAWVYYQFTARELEKIIKNNLTH